MAYPCPVCAEPQADAEHLANHLAFTAMLSDDGHEGWLDEHTPGWEAEDESGLADRLRDSVETVDHPIDDVETHDHSGHDHDESDGHDPRVASDTARSGVNRGPAALDSEAQEIVAEARALTREMEASSDGDDEGGDGDPAADETE